MSGWDISFKDSSYDPNNEDKRYYSGKFIVSTEAQYVHDWQSFFWYLSPIYRYQTEPCMQVFVKCHILSAQEKAIQYSDKIKNYSQCRTDVNTATYFPRHNTL